jgi:5,10-methylenetetrahydromethanopterin reductase
VKIAQRPIVVSPRIARATDLIERARVAEELGVDQIWLDQLPDQRDATVVAGAYLQHTKTAMVGTAILPIYARHPLTTVQTALSLADLYQDRFILGLGFSHHYVNEHVLGYQQGPPIRAMREYLHIVRSLLVDGEVDTEGSHFSAHARYVSTRRPTPLVIAALRPQMIRLAVEYTDGLLVWLCSPRFVSEHVTPVVEKACARFGKDPAEFQVMTLLPAYATGDPRSAYERMNRQFATYRLIPYYRSILEAYGPVDAEQLCLFGSKDRIQARMAEFRAAGATAIVSPVGPSLEDFAQTISAAFDP